MHRKHNAARWCLLGRVYEGGAFIHCRGVVIAARAWVRTAASSASAGVCTSGANRVRDVCSGLHRRRPVGHPPSASIGAAPASRRSPPVGGDATTDEVRRLIPRSSRSCAVFVQILSRWASGSVMHAKCPLRASARPMMPSGL